jgi:tetratricopeptide (TPR) repeat protein
MLTKDMSKTDIDQALAGKGDFVQIDYLTRLLRENIPMDKKRHAYAKLGELYEKKRMMVEAAKMFNNIALLSVTYNDKIKNHVKEAELYIKGGDFFMADEALRKALKEATGKEKDNITKEVKEFYKLQGMVYEKEQRRNQAIKLYEKFLQMNISDAERQEIKTKLSKLYESTGRLKEYFTLSKGGNVQKLENPKEVMKTQVKERERRYTDDVWGLKDLRQ